MAAHVATKQLEQMAQDEKARREGLRAQQRARLAAVSRWTKSTKKERTKQGRIAGEGNRHRSKKSLSEHARHAALLRWQMWREQHPELYPNLPDEP